MQMPGTALFRLFQQWWNGNSYDPNNNPGGLANNGHRLNFAPTMANNGICVLMDVATVAQQAATWAQMASSCAAGNGGWLTLLGVAYARISATQFTAQISPNADLTPYFSVNRKLMISQTTSGFGVVTASSYNASTGLTTVTVGVTGMPLSIANLDTGFNDVTLGQDPQNAPAASGGGAIASAHYINANFPTA